MRPDLIQAQAFLTALDEYADSWSFQTFADDGSGRQELIRLLHGTLDNHGATLEKLNDQGAGVFVTVNKTDGRGRKKSNITRARALFVDLDGAPIQPVRNSPTPPHIVVESSPGRYHAYWRVSDCSVDACEPALKELIQRFDGDKSCCDRSRVLRLPGFLHRKGDPFPVRIIDTSPGQYTLDDLGLTATYRRAQRNQKSSSVPSVPSVSSVSSVGEEIIRYQPESVGQRNRCLFALARYLRGVVPDATRKELREIVQQWHKLALPVIGSADFSESWGDFLRSWESVHTPHGSVLNSILERIEMAEAIPENIAALGYQEKGYRLICICEQLQRHAGDKPFFLAARQAGELIDAHFTDASKILYALVADGVLELVRRGAGKVASRYRYIWPANAAAADEGDHSRRADQEAA